MEEKLVTIASFSDYAEAELAKQTLEEFGIKSLVAGEDGCKIMYGGLFALIDLDLRVFESQAQRAQEILESQGKQEQ